MATNATTMTSRKRILCRFFTVAYRVKNLKIIEKIGLLPDEPADIVSQEHNQG